MKNKNWNSFFFGKKQLFYLRIREYVSEFAKNIVHIKNTTQIWFIFI